MKHKDAIVMKIHTRNIFQQITGNMKYMNTAAPQGTEKETQKRDSLISYRLAGA
jgi:hypothetical protein